MSNRRDSLRDSLGLLMLVACGKTAFNGTARIGPSTSGTNNVLGSPTDTMGNSTGTTGEVTQTTNATAGINLNSTPTGTSLNSATTGTNLNSSPTATMGTNLNPTSAVNMAPVSNSTTGMMTPANTVATPTDPSLTVGYRGLTVGGTDLCTPAESRGYVRTKKDTDKTLLISNSKNTSVTPTSLTINQAMFYGKISNACIALRFVTPQNTPMTAPIWLVPGDTVQVLAPVSGNSVRAFVVARLEVTDFSTQDVIFDNLNLTGLTQVQILVTRKEGTQNVRYFGDLTLNFSAQFNGMDVVHALNASDQSSNVQTSYYNNYPDLIFQIDSGGVNVGPKSTDNGAPAANLIQGDTTTTQWSTNFTSSFGQLYDFFGNVVSNPTTAIQNSNYFIVYKTSTVDNKSYAFRYVFHFG